MKLDLARLVSALLIVVSAVPAVGAQSASPPAPEQTIDIHTLLFIEWPWDAGYANRQDPFDVNSTEILFDSLSEPRDTDADLLKVISSVK